MEDDDEWNKNLCAEVVITLFVRIEDGARGVEADFLIVVVGFPSGDLFAGDGAIDAELGGPAIAAFFERLVDVE